MLKNYLIVALRNLGRHRGYSAINIAGLTIGLASCLLIFQYVAYETSFDRYHEHGEELFRVVLTTVSPDDSRDAGANNPYGFGEAIRERVPEVTHVARIHPDYMTPVIANPQRPGVNFEEDDALYVDPDFLSMFTVPFVAGDASRALREPGTIVLSESAAQRYFGEENPIGQELSVTGWISGPFRVTGVFEDVPANSHLPFEFLLPMEDLLTRSDFSDPGSAWNWFNFLTYVQLREGAEVGAAEQKVSEIWTAQNADRIADSGVETRANLQPLFDIHLNDAVSASRAVVGSYRTVYFFTIIGLVTLLIALINYVNLATARAMERAREVGVRKAVGAGRGRLIGQFLLESGLTNLIAFVLAIVVAVTVRPLVDYLVGAELMGSIWSSGWFWGAFLLTLLSGTLLAGLYPAFVLSSFRPVTVLKGQAVTFGGRLRLRQALVIVQFTASIVLVVGTVVAHRQLAYIRTMDLGLELDQIMTVPGPRVLPEGASRDEAVRTLVQELRQIPGVQQIATSMSVPGEGFQFTTSAMLRQGADPADAVDGAFTAIDRAFPELYGLTLIAGNGFDDIADPTAGSTSRPAILNETAVRALGYDSPEGAIGEIVDVGGMIVRVVGVYRDFSWSSAHLPRESMVFALQDTGPNLSIEVAPANLPATIAAVESAFTRLFPGNPFRYGFVDETFDAQYRREERFATMFTLFAGLAIAIACLGLLGLASFAAQRRTKEIGVRKVLGATVPGLVALLSKDFLKLVGIAVLIATPPAYFLMREWLDSFAYQITLGPGVFVIAGGLALLVALVTVAFQSFRAATLDPAQSIRYE